jgi:hypothetical protein
MLDRSHNFVRGAKLCGQWKDMRVVQCLRSWERCIRSARSPWRGIEPGIAWASLWPRTTSCVLVQAAVRELYRAGQGSTWGLEPMWTLRNIFTWGDLLSLQSREESSTSLLSGCRNKAFLTAKNAFANRWRQLGHAAYNVKTRLRTSGGSLGMRRTDGYAGEPLHDTLGMRRIMSGSSLCLQVT